MADGRIIIDTLLDPHGLEKGLASIGDVAKKGLKVFTGAVVAGGAAMTGLGIKAISLASDLDEVQNVVDVTFGDNAEIINQWAKEAAESFGMSELAYKKYSGSLGAMLKSMGLTSEQVKNMSGNMVDLAGDMASFYNLDHDTAFEKIRAGISGETEPLKQLGINMSVANLEAFRLAEGLKKPYNQMTQSEQAMLRYQYLMSATADAQGDFERTSDGLANQLRIAKLNIESLTSELGNLLLPVAQEAVKSFNDIAGKLKEAFEDPAVQESIKSIAESIGDLITNVANFVADHLPDIIDGFAWILDNAGTIAAGVVGIGVALTTMNVANMILGLVNAFKAFKLANEGATVAQWLMNAAMSASPIILVVGLITGLVAAIITLWNTNEDFRNAVIGAWEKIKEVASDVWGGICDFFTEDIPNAFESVKSFFTEDVPNWFKEQCDKAKQFVIDGWNSISDFFTITIPAKIDEIGQWFSEIPYKIGYALGEAYLTVQGWGQQVSDFFTVTIPGWIDSIGTWFSELPGRIKTWFDQSVADAKQWLSDIYTSCETSIDKTIEDISTWFSALPRRVKTWFNNTVDEAKQWGRDMYSTAEKYVTDTVNGIIDWFKDLPGRMKEIGKNIVEGIGEGISSAKDYVIGKITGVKDNIVNGFKDALGIHSPSRLMRDIIGTNIVKGIGVGIEYEMPDLNKQIDDNIENLTSMLKGTVDYETARTTARVVAENNVNVENTNSASKNYNPSFNIIAKVSVPLDSEVIAEVTTPMVIENISEDQNSYSISRGGN